VKMRKFFTTIVLSLLVTLWTVSAKNIGKEMHDIESSNKNVEKGGLKSSSKMTQKKSSGWNGGSGYYPGNSGGNGNSNGGGFNQGSSGFQPGNQNPHIPDFVPDESITGSNNNGGFNQGGSGFYPGNQSPNIPDFVPDESITGPNNGGGFNQGGSGFYPGNQSPNIPDFVPDESITGPNDGGGFSQGGSGFYPGNQNPNIPDFVPDESITGPNNGGNFNQGGSGYFPGNQSPHIPDFVPDESITNPGSGQNGFNPGTSGFNPGTSGAHSGSGRPEVSEERIVFPRKSDTGGRKKQGANTFRTKIQFAEEKNKKETKTHETTMKKNSKNKILGRDANRQDLLVKDGNQYLPYSPQIVPIYLITASETGLGEQVVPVTPGWSTQAYPRLTASNARTTFSTFTDPVYVQRDLPHGAQGFQSPPVGFLPGVQTRPRYPPSFSYSSQATPNFLRQKTNQKVQQENRLAPKTVIYIF